MEQDERFDYGECKKIYWVLEKEAKKPWVTDEMLAKMEQRRKYKSVNNDTGKRMYRKLNNELKRATEKARDRWWNDECTELERLDKVGTTDLLYSHQSVWLM